jgi:hypothetical protein
MAIWRRLGRAAWVLALLAAPAWPQAPDAAWTTRTVHGYRFAFAVETVLYPGGPGDPRHARIMEHRVVVSIRDADSRRPVQASAVSLDVAEQGYKGLALPMQADRSEPGIYEVRVRMQRGVPHRVLVHATPQPGSRTLEAQFEYRHHH